MLIAWENLADDATVSTDSEQSSLPASNVQNEHVAKKWSTAAGVTSAYLIFDMLASVTVELLAILGTNLSSSATIRIRSSDSDSSVTSSLEYDSGTVAAGVVAGYGAIYKEITATQSRYWRIDLTDSSITEGLRAGRVFLGPSWEPSIAMLLGAASVTPEDPSEVSESYGGQTYADLKPQRRVLEFTLDYMDEAEMYGNAFALARANGVVTDVLVIPDIDSAYLSQQAVWGQCTGYRPLVFADIGRYQQKFQIRERL